MKLRELADKIGAKILTHEEKAAAAEIDRIYAGDRMSDLLSHSSETTLLVTNLSNTVLRHVAELMSVPGICLLNGVTPEQEIVRSALENDTVLIVSPVGMFETCGRLYKCLGA
jgi:hypothetical protein